MRKNEVFQNLEIWIWDILEKTHSNKREKFAFENYNRLLSFVFQAQVATIQIENLERKNI